MTDRPSTQPHGTAPGDEPLDAAGVLSGLRGYLVGFAIALGLSAASVAVTGGHVVWREALPVALIVLAIAQMGVHLVFFIHITSGPDSTNNVMALAFGVLIVLLLISGSLWIMSNLDANMLPMSRIMDMQR